MKDRKIHLIPVERTLNVKYLADQTEAIEILSQVIIDSSENVSWKDRLIESHITKNFSG